MSTMDKAKAIARLAVEHGWKGKISPNKETQTISLYAERNDEKIQLVWQGTKFAQGQYAFFDKVTMIASSGAGMLKITDWPDIIALLKVIPIESRPQVTSVYVKLPFDWETDDDEFIIGKMIERKLFWYNRIDGKIETDVVMNSKKTRIQPVGHRKLFHFISPVVGFRSVLLDQVLRVG